jgi:hypothetical protein
MSTIIRIDPLEKSSVVANDTSTFIIPRGVYDLSTLKLWFLATINGAAPDFMSLPRDVETMIETLQVFIGDQEVQHIQNYNQIFRTIEDYDKDMNEHNQRCVLSNSFMSNNNQRNALFNVSSTQFCMTKWIGLLGSGVVINTHKIGQIRFVITWAPNNVLMSNTVNSTYKLDNLYVTLNHTSDQDSTQIHFDDFKTQIQSNPSFAQTTQMNVKSRQLDYVMSIFLPVDYKTKRILGPFGNYGTSYYYAHGSGDTSFPNIDWNFSVNNKNLISYNPPAEQYIEYMRDIFEGCYHLAIITYRTGRIVAESLSKIMQYSWATGVRTDNVDASEGINLAFNTYGSSSGINIPNFSMLVAKTSSLLTVDQSGGYTVEK